MTAPSPSGLVINVAVYDALKLPRPLHGGQGRAGCSIPWSVIEHFLFIKLEKLFRTRIIKCTGIHFFHTIAITVFNVICFILLLDSYESSLFHHTGTTERYRIVAVIQNFPQLSYLPVHSDTSL